MRCITRAVKRAEIPIWYTEGFNPHPFMTFALPLSLGTESLCESVDIRLTEDMSSDDIIFAMNNALPVDIKVIKASEPVLEATEIAFADYKISFYTGEIDILKFILESTLNSDEIITEKKAKKGRRKIFKEINLKENIKDFSFETNEEALILNITLTAGSFNNINPNLLIDALLKPFTGEIQCIDILKLKFYTEDMREFE